MIKGSCLCGGVKFEINEARSLTYCYSRNCRKLSGAHVASYVHVDADKFRFVAGEELIQTFESAPGSFRNFCRVCSSTLPGKAPYLATVSIPSPRTRLRKNRVRNRLNLEVLRPKFANKDGTAQKVTRQHPIAESWRHGACALDDTLCVIPRHLHIWRSRGTGQSAGNHPREKAVAQDKTSGEGRSQRHD